MYLVQRHNIFWAFHDVPRPLHKALGRRLRKNLRTDHEATAKRLAAILWAHQWARLVGNATDKRGTELEAVFYAEMLQEAQTERERELMSDHIAERAEVKYRAAKSDSEREAALRFNKAAQGKFTALAPYVTSYLHDIRDKRSTKAAKAKTLQSFTDAFPYVEEVQPRAIQTWLTDLVRAEGLTRTTARKRLSFIRTFWRYLMDAGVTETDLVAAVRVPSTAPSGIRRDAFTPQQVVALVDAAKAKEDQELVDVITLAMWTGARIEEIAQLKVEDVHLTGSRSFNIRESKTDAGRRQVPIHSALAATLKRLVGNRKTGYVIAGPSAAKYDGRRAKALGTRFTVMKTKLGHGPELVFHSIRHTVATQLHNAGVSVETAADVLGHARKGMTFGDYSAGASLETKRAVVGALKYPRSRGSGVPKG